MQTLTVSKETFIEMLPSLVASGVAFTSIEKNHDIIITFTGY